MLEVVEEHIQREVAALEEQRRGAVLITVGKVLLWMDLILLCFVYSGLRVGSHLFLWWVLGEGLLGLALMAVGSHDIADGRVKLAQLTSRYFYPHDRTHSELPL
jgi:pheromone shutdown protein TraB